MKGSDQQAQDGASSEDWQSTPIRPAQQHQGPQQIRLDQGAQERPVLDPDTPRQQHGHRQPQRPGEFLVRQRPGAGSDHAVARAAAITKTSSASRTTNGKAPNWNASWVNCQLPANGSPGRSDPWTNGATPQLRHKTSCQARATPKGTAKLTAQTRDRPLATLAVDAGRPASTATLELG